MGGGKITKISKIIEGGKMKALIFKLLLIFGLIILILFISKDQKVLASESYGGDLTEAEIAYDSHNKVWAFVGMKSRQIYAQIYNNNNGRPGHQLLAEKCLSEMVHTPGRPGTEDYIFRRMTKFYLITTGAYRGEIPINTDMTDPSLRYFFDGIKIIYNPRTRSFLAIWKQYSSGLGEQLVGQAFIYDGRNRAIFSLEEPRVLNRVPFIYDNGILKPDKNIQIYSSDIDVTTDFDYAIVATTYSRTAGTEKHPLIRLVHMGISENTYHYDPLESKYLSTYENYLVLPEPAYNWKLENISASIYKNPIGGSVKICILYLFRSCRGESCIIIRETNADLEPNRNDWRNNPYLIIPTFGRCQSNVIIRINPITMRPVILYSQPNLIRLIDHNQNVLAEITLQIRDDDISNPTIKMTQTGCLLTFQRMSGIVLDGRWLDFGYIFGKYISFLRPSRDISSCFLVSVGKPADGWNKGIVYNPDTGKAICYWDTTRDSFPKLNWDIVNLHSYIPPYDSNLQISQDPNIQGRVNFSWNRYPASNNLVVAEIPRYSLYILTSDGQIHTPEYPNTQLGTNAYWQNIGQTRQIAAFLCVSDVFTPRLSIALSNLMDSNIATLLVDTPGPTLDHATISGIRSPDSDGDGLTDNQENSIGTNPNQRDTDSDGLTDGQEYNTCHTRPLKADSDSDGLTDGQEYNTYHTNPLNPDSDNDALTDGEEINVYHTNPTAPNTINFARRTEANPAAISSSEFNSNYSASKAIDGGLEENNEWATNGEKNGAWLEISWSRAVPIKTIILRDRRNMSDNVTQFSIMVYTENGGFSAFSGLGPLPNGIENRSVPAEPYRYSLSTTLRATKVRILITGTSPSTMNIGLAEVEAYNI